MSYEILPAEIKVRLLSSSDEGLINVVKAAKLCYSNMSIDDLSDKIDSSDESDVAMFIDKLMRMGHESPLEHASYTFAIEGVSRSLLAQITRHRIASFSVQSQRYVKLKDVDIRFVIPESFTDEIRQLYIDQLSQCVDTYSTITTKLMDKYTSQGMSVYSAEKKAIEDARYILPNATPTKLIMTMNARSLLNFFELRCCNRAQWEIRHLATEMYKLVYTKAPHIFKHSGPGCCIYGKCTQHNMCCGNMSDVIKNFDDIREEIDSKCHNL